jgi:hypothetical protein
VSKCGAAHDSVQSRLSAVGKSPRKPSNPVPACWKIASSAGRARGPVRALCRQRSGQPSGQPSGQSQERSQRRQSSLGPLSNTRRPRSAWSASSCLHASAPTACSGPGTRQARQVALSVAGRRVGVWACGCRDVCVCVLGNVTRRTTPCAPHILTHTRPRRAPSSRRWPCDS